MSDSEALVVNFDIHIDEEDISLPHAKKTRILVKERVHGLFKTSGFVHVLQSVHRSSVSSFVENLSLQKHTITDSQCC
jgi:hypothetical protein